LERLEAILAAPVPDVAALIAALRAGVVKLEALGDLATALVTEGRDLIALLEGDRSEEGRKRLADWLRRIDRLMQPAERDMMENTVYLLPGRSNLLQDWGETIASLGFDAWGRFYLSRLSASRQATQACRRTPIPGTSGFGNTH